MKLSSRAVIQHPMNLPPTSSCVLRQDLKTTPKSSGSMSQEYGEYVCKRDRIYHQALSHEKSIDAAAKQTCR